MSVAPEVLFDRYFRGLSLELRRAYKGKHDLDKLELPQFQPLLLDLQEAINQQLMPEQSVIGDGSRLPFHLDFIDSAVQNALAFRYEGYWFIGLTIELIYSLWDLCVRLSKSDKIASLLGVQILGEGSEALRVVLFRTAVVFIVMHEYAHLLHGHVASLQGELLPLNEIVDDGPVGDVTEQTFEADADAFAAHLGMTNLISGAARPLAVSVLGIDALPEAIQDEVLFSCFAVAVGTFLLLRGIPTLESDTVYKLTHPPPAVRIDGVMQQSILWCRQNRPSLGAWMTPNRFDTLINGVAEIFWEASDGVRNEWVAQMKFLQSTDGLEYLRRLGASLAAYVSSLGPKNTQE
jgi:hypothetical protein